MAGVVVAAVTVVVVGIGNTISSVFPEIAKNVGVNLISSRVEPIFQSIIDQAKILITNSSEGLWKMLLPSDHQEIIASASPHLDIPTKKELFFHLRKFPILLHGETSSFKIDKMSGKKCFMLGARALSFTHGDDTQYMKWNSHPDPRFPNVAELGNAHLLQTKGHMNTKILSPKSTYVAYLVFDFARDSDGLEFVPVKASTIRSLGTGRSLVENRTICLLSEASSCVVTCTRNLNSDH